MKTPKKIMGLSKSHNTKLTVMAVVIMAVVLIGVIIIAIGHASTHYVSVSAASGTVTSPAVVQSDANAINGRYVKFSAPNGICGFKSGASTVNKVMIIWEENKDYSQVIGSGSAPYINNTIVKNCANATNYNANGHYSLPNYMTMTSSLNNGSSYFSSGPWSGDCTPTSSGCSTSTKSIFQQLGSNWKSFVEDMPSNCDTSSDYAYAKHNPAVYYTAIPSTTCHANDVPFSAGAYSSGALYSAIQSGLPALSTVTPNLCNDMHDCGVSSGDTWLSKWIPVITAGRDYQNGNLAILIVGDEGSGSNSTSSSHTFAVGLSAYTKLATQSGTSFDENSILRTMEDITGQSPIGGAGSANTMVSAFGF